MWYPRILTMEPGVVAHRDNVNVCCGGKTIIVRDQKMEQRFSIREFLQGGPGIPTISQGVL